MSECVCTKQNVKLKITVRFKSGDPSAKRISHFLVLLRFLHSPPQSMLFNSFFVIKVGEQQFHLPMLDEGINILGLNYQNMPFIRSDKKLFV